MRQQKSRVVAAVEDGSRQIALTATMAMSLVICAATLLR